MNSLRSAYATGAGGGAAAAAAAAAPATGRDLRGSAARRTLRFAPGDRVVVSGLPGSGKSTLIRRTVALTGEADDAAGRAPVHTIDSQDTRERWEARLPSWLPYGLYRPLARLAHYASLRRALASGGGVVVHDCGTQGWVRDWLARDSRRRGRALHLVLLDVSPQTALQGQAERGRGVSGYAFLRHRRAVGRLIEQAEAGRLPAGFASVVLLDRTSAAALDAVVFD
ncbi:AAA family ATPase [Streptomyces sp. HNM0574]|uniref:AAA family ATPase n=1 Tax=Streptomyces sp. HNM0574 TaxID=2714954 RepID=UPI003216934A